MQTRLKSRPQTAHLGNPAIVWLRWLICLSVLLPSLPPAPAAAAPAMAMANRPESAQQSGTDRPDHPGIESQATSQMGATVVPGPSAPASPDLPGPAFQDIDLGNGRRLAIFPAELVQTDGAEPEMPPTFLPGPDGFTLDNVGLSARLQPSDLRLHVAGPSTALEWQPLALESKLANRIQPLAWPTNQPDPGTLSPDARTVTVANGWSTPHLKDEIVAGSGQIEHNVILSAPLNISPAAEEVRMRARLHLSTGARLVLNGQIQTAAFSTNESVEIHSLDGGTPLVLLPALVYEKERPEVGMTARYNFKPAQDGWSVTMTTPAAWWREPSRRYPVVWDPTVQVLRPSAFAQRVLPGCGKLPHQVAVGHFEYPDGPWTIKCTYRALLRFNNLSKLTLPPGYVIEKATLYVVPDGGFANIRYDSYKEMTGNFEVRPVTQDWASEGTVGWDNAPTVGAPIGPAQRFWRYASFVNAPFSSFLDDLRFVVQQGPNGLVTDWLTGKPNYGFELRAVPGQEASCAGGCNYAKIPKATAWPQSDKDFGFNGLERTGGVALQIQYRGPVLPEGQAIGLDNNPLPLPVPSDADLNRTFHGYQVQPSNGAEWTAVGVKALRRTLFDGSGIQMVGTFSHVQWAGFEEEFNPVQRTASFAASNAYEMPISVAYDDNTGAEFLNGFSKGEKGLSSNFVLVRGKAADEMTVRVHAQPKDDRIDSYAVEVARSQPLLPAVDEVQVREEGFSHTYEFELTTDHLLALRSINLPENSNVLVRLESEFSQYNTAPVEARIYPPTENFFRRDVPPVALAKENGRGQPFPVQAGKGGQWALLLNLPGDVTPVNVDDGECVLEQADCENPTVQTVRFKLKLVVCPINADAKESGCKFHYKPVPGVTPSMRVDIPGGYYLVYSNGGFVDCNLPPFGQTGDRCTRADTKWVTYITWNGALQRMVAVAGGVVRANNTVLQNPTRNLRRLELESARLPDNTNEDPTVSLGFCSEDPVNPIYPRQIVWVGGERASMTDPVIGEKVCLDDCMDLPLSESDAQDYTVFMSVNVRDQVAKGRGKMVRPLPLANGGVDDLKLNIGWQVRAEGYRGKVTASPQADGPTARSAVAESRPGPRPIAGLLYWFTDAWDIYYDPSDGFFTSIRNSDGRIYQAPKLGGAWNRVDHVILPFGVSPDGGNGIEICRQTGGFCGDIRSPEDSWERPRRDWLMPDVNVAGSARTVMYRQEGAVQVYSSDHPMTGQEAGATDVGFSFQTFGARVQVTDDVCPGSSNPERVQVIKGSTSMGLPGLGSGSTDTGLIQAGFTLCESKLRQVTLKYDQYPTGIPISVPPVMYVNSIGGSVTIDPEYTIIEVEIGFFVGDPATPLKLFKGTGKVTIDTRGLFDMQATGRIMGMMDAEGHLWVAWNPLDLGFGVAGYLPKKENWLMQGFAYAHVWRGRGWQDRYKWLPDDDAFHMTASYQATFKIPEGEIIDTWPLVIPPDDIHIGVELSFGQFCANAQCSGVRWGIKGVLKIAGFSVGAYVNLECDELIAGALIPPLILLCTSFIIGSDGHVLIDQYGGNGPPFPRRGQTMEELERPSPAEIRATGWVDRATLRVGGQSTSMNYRTVADPSAATMDAPLTVSPETESFMVAMGWVRGAPTLSLVNPDGEIINSENALAHSVGISVTDHMILYGVANPMAGEWQARVENATEMSDYRIAFFANKAAPKLTFTQPVAVEAISAQADGTTAQNYTIRWQPPQDSAHLRLSLYYSVTNGTALTTTQQSGGVIVENLDPALGSYEWDLAYLSTGDFHIYATLQDAAGSEITPTGKDQYVGVTRSDAPGRLRYTDLTGPPALNPATVTFSPLQNGVRMCWDVSPARDLQGYVIIYHLSGDPNNGPFGRTERRRVLADVPYGPDARQCTRIGGLVPNESRISFVYQEEGIAAFDASLNESAYVKPGSTTVPGILEIQGGPIALSGVANNDGTVTLTWPYTTATAFELYYAKEMPAGPWQPAEGADEGSSPNLLYDITYDGSYTLHGLTPGHWYAFAVRWAGPGNFYYSQLSNQLWLLVTQSGDQNGDGCADDWQQTHDAPNVAEDPDQDGLNNGEECQQGTNPLDPDTDDDGWRDGDEVRHGTDPLDPTSRPELTESGEPLVPEPRLALSSHRLSYYAFTQGPNPAAQSVEVINLGAGSLAPSVSTNRPWLQATIMEGVVQVAVNKSGLARGRYEGAVTVTASGAQGSPRQIQVYLEILAGSPPGQAVGDIYLPIVLRNAGTQPQTTVTPTPTPSNTPTETRTATATATATPSQTTVATATPSSTSTQAATPTTTPSATPSPTGTGTAQLTETPTGTPTATKTPTTTATQTPTATPTATATSALAENLVVYDDALATGWEDWSWDTTVDFASSFPVHSGSAAISVQHTAPWAGLSLRASAPLATEGYGAIQFWIYTDDSLGNELAFYVQTSDSGAASSWYNFESQPSQWTQITVPLSAVDNPSQIARINIQDRSGVVQAPYLLDDIQFTVSGSQR